MDTEIIDESTFLKLAFFLETQLRNSETSTIIFVKNKKGAK